MATSIAPGGDTGPLCSARMFVAFLILSIIFFESELLSIAGLAGFRLSGTHNLLKSVDHGRGTVAPLHDGPAPLFDGAQLYEYESRADTLARLAATPAALLAPLTLEAQRLLYEWQHPAECVGRRFLVSRGNEETAGLGSHVHISTHHVALAFEMGLIFLWHPDAGIMYTDEGTCADGTINFECFFDAPSNCTLDDARDPASSITEVRNGDAGLHVPGAYQFYHVPRVFTEMWERAHLPVVFGETTRQSDALKYWFRGQVAAYLARFNRATLGSMRELRQNKSLLLHAIGPHASPGAAAALEAGTLFPLAPGTISVHIRHGDKHLEMSLVPTAAYFEEATVLARRHPMALGGHRMFLSTEDPEAVGEVSKAVLTAGIDGRRGAWIVSWWDVPRENSNGKSQLANFNLPRGKLTIIWWLQLFIALEADAWVGTRGSNWNRLIDELRCVWVPKCQNIFAEVGDEARWEHLSWRRA